jgi:hypothetical protein
VASAARATAQRKGEDSLTVLRQFKVMPWRIRELTILLVDIGISFWDLQHNLIGKALGGTNSADSHTAHEEILTLFVKPAESCASVSPLPGRGYIWKRELVKNPKRMADWPRFRVQLWSASLCSTPWVLGRRRPWR